MHAGQGWPSSYSSKMFATEQYNNGREGGKKETLLGRSFWVVFDTSRQHVPLEPPRGDDQQHLPPRPRTRPQNPSGRARTQQPSVSCILCRSYPRTRPGARRLEERGRRTTHRCVWLRPPPGRRPFERSTPSIPFLVLPRRFTQR